MRRWVAVLVACVVLACPAAPAREAGARAAFAAGDANGDGSISMADVFCLIAALFAAAALPGNGDVDGDGRVGVNDLLGLIGSLLAHERLVRPGDLTYAGAFRLPGDEERPRTFDYGGNAMTFRPGGDPSGPADGFPGSLFITGHDRMPYGDLPDGDQVAEVSIPNPVVSKALDDLPVAGFLQGFADVAAGFFTQLDEIPKVGLAHLDHPDTGPLVHLAWGQHLQPPDAPSHAWFSPTLAAPSTRGTWFIGTQELYGVNGYMFPLPLAWADEVTGGRPIATGRMRDGGQGGMGPTLFAYRPWLAGGTAPATGTRLSEVTLLQYENVVNTPDIERCLVGYQHADEWEGGAFIATPSGTSAVVFAGNKGTGSKFWYGYINPGGAGLPCVDDAVTDFTTCRWADGSPCPATDLTGCCGGAGPECVSQRGWWSTRFDGQLIFFDPTDLARVAAGELAPWQPQPYAVLDIDDRLLFQPAAWDLPMIGWGDQRRYRVGDAAFDPQASVLYVLEQFGDGARPLVHVWRVR